MPRALAVLLTPALLLVTASAAPIPGDKPKAYAYHPMKAGAKWVYSFGEKEVVNVLSAVETKDGTTRLTIIEEGGKAASMEKMVLSDEGIFRVEALGEKVDPPLWLLKLPHKHGHKWETDSSDPGFASETRFTAFGPEDIEVPAGKFKAIRVESEVTFTGIDGAVRSSEWYAPGVGLVKRTVGESVMVLKSFTPGKD